MASVFRLRDVEWRHLWWWGWSQKPWRTKNSWTSCGSEKDDMENSDEERKKKSKMWSLEKECLNTFTIHVSQCSVMRRPRNPIGRSLWSFHLQISADISAIIQAKNPITQFSIGTSSRILPSIYSGCNLVLISANYGSEPEIVFDGRWLFLFIATNCLWCTCEMQNSLWEIICVQADVHEQFLVLLADWPAKCIFIPALIWTAICTWRDSINLI